MNDELFKRLVTARHVHVHLLQVHRLDPRKKCLCVWTIIRRTKFTHFYFFCELKSVVHLKVCEPMDHGSHFAQAPEFYFYYTYENDVLRFKISVKMVKIWTDSYLNHFFSKRNLIIQTFGFILSPKNSNALLEGFKKY